MFLNDRQFTQSTVHYPHLESCFLQGLLPDPVDILYLMIPSNVEQWDKHHLPDLPFLQTLQHIIQRREPLNRTHGKLWETRVRSQIFQLTIHRICSIGRTMPHQHHLLIRSMWDFLL